MMTLLKMLFFPFTIGNILDKEAILIAQIKAQSKKITKVKINRRK